MIYVVHTMDPHGKACVGPPGIVAAKDRRNFAIIELIGFYVDIGVTALASLRAP